MSTHPRIASLLLARAGLVVVALGFALAGLWSANDLWGQDPGKPPAARPKKPRVEEEEDAPKAKPKKKLRVEEEEETPKAKPKRKVIQVEDDDEPKAKGGPNRPAAPASGDLKQLAQQTRHKGARELFKELEVPHDQIVWKKLERVTSNQGALRGEEDVEPIPVYLGIDPTRFRRRLMIQPLTSDWKRDKPYSPNLERIQYVRPYERIAADKVRDFLKQAYDSEARNKESYLSRFDMLTVAEQALAAVLRWHESALQTGQRTGDEWKSIEAELRKQLLDEILLPQMQVLTQNKDWDRALALLRRLAVSYTNDDDRKRIARPIADMLQNALNNPTASEKSTQQTRQRLQELEREFPGNPVFQPITKGLRADAEKLLEEAKKLAAEKNDPDKLRRAMELLQRAEEIWPQLPELRAFRLELSEEHPILRVGVRGPLPRYLSPAWACTDTEKRIVEMLFEGLVKVSPDESGIFRYRPGLAEYRPKVKPLGRQFQLPRNAEWSNHQRIDSGDIRFTVNLLRKGVGVGRSCAWGQMLDKVEVKGDPYRVTLRLNQGYLDPLALMTFKILPRDKQVDTEKFAENPVCSGPFVFDPLRRSDENRRGCAFFVANPAYGSRPGKRDLPRIQEVRFYSYTDAEKELRQENKLDLVLDLTAEEAAKLAQAKDELQLTVPMPAATTPNRRIYFLAINQSKLPNKDLRKALAYAINREGLLDVHFRGPLKGKGVHKALNGPFPAGSWACNPAEEKRQDGGSQGLFAPDKAQSMSNLPAVRKAIEEEGTLKLKYPEGDPVLAKALTDLCEQVKKTTGIVLDPMPCDPCQLRKDVELTQSYDLAYYHYDFPDETYWLWPLLGPPIREEGVDSNPLKFANAGIQNTLKAAMSYRDFDQVRKHLWTVHVSLNREMPLIPLWQLDPLLAYHRAVKPAALDPVLVFTNIEEWRLQPSR